jgi:hypothetical protein
MLEVVVRLLSFFVRHAHASLVKFTSLTLSYARDFCFDKMDDPQWKCYHHPVASTTCAEEVRQEITTLQASLHADLDVIERRSKKLYEANPNAIS